MFSLQRYNIIKCNQKYLYSFISKGINGNYYLYAKLEPSYIKNIYQLEFGPFKESTITIDTSFTLNNNDTDKIIGTVAYIIYLFLKENPNGIVRFSGSTASRSRLFSMWIIKNWEELQNFFIIYGCTFMNKWERFKTNNRYGAILMKSLNPKND